MKNSEKNQALIFVMRWLNVCIFLLVSPTQNLKVKEDRVTEFHASTGSSQNSAGKSRGSVTSSTSNSLYYPDETSSGTRLSRTMASKSRTPAAEYERLRIRARVADDGARSSSRYAEIDNRQTVSVSGRSQGSRVSVTKHSTSAKSGGVNSKSDSSLGTRMSGGRRKLNEDEIHSSPSVSGSKRSRSAGVEDDSGISIDGELDEQGEDSQHTRETKKKGVLGKSVLTVKRLVHGKRKTDTDTETAEVRRVEEGGIKKKKVTEKIRDFSHTKKGKAVLIGGPVVAGGAALLGAGALAAAAAAGTVGVVAAVSASNCDPC